jgi:hypothetical protein
MNIHTTANFCGPLPLIRSRARLLTGVVAALMAALGAVMSVGLGNYTFDHAFHHDIDSPILAVELASTSSELGKVLDPPATDEPKAKEQARAVLRTNTYEDCALILLYTSFLWSFGTLFAVRGEGSRTHLRVLAFVIIATGVSDYTENMGIFRALGARQLTDSLAQHICWPSRCKWSLLGITLLLTAVILLRSGNPIYSLATRRLLAIGYMMAAALVITGLWYPVLIELGMKVFGLIVLINAVALLGPYVSEWIPAITPVYVDDFCERKREGMTDVAVSAKPRE